MHVCVHAHERGREGKGKKERVGVYLLTCLISLRKEGIDDWVPCLLKMLHLVAKLDLAMQPTAQHISYKSTDTVMHRSIQYVKI